MPLAGFEPAIPISERPQVHALDRAATGIGDQNLQCIVTVSGVVSVCIVQHTTNSIPLESALKNP